jgi:hypothetical protein
MSRKLARELLFTETEWKEAVLKEEKMTAKRIFGLFLIFVFSLSLLAVFAEALPSAQRPPQKKAPAAQEKIFIPKEIKAVLQEGLISRQGRQDIPFEIFKNFVFPAQQDYYPVFLFKVKNGDLGFAPSADVTLAGYEARQNVFLQFLAEDTEGVPQIQREIYVPFAVRQDSEGYDPEKVDWYSVGVAMLPGKYTLAMAITSTDLQKVGVQYYDFVLPDPGVYQQSLDTTPIFFSKDMKTMETPEQRPVVHRGMFTYAILQIVPNIDNVVSPGEDIELMYYIFGTKAKEAEAGQRPENDIEVAYEVKKDDDSIAEDQKLAIRWEAQKYDFALVSQPLPLKQTVIIKDEKGERTEQRDLAAGKYILCLAIKDNLSGMTLEKTVPFEVK